MSQPYFLIERVHREETFIKEGQGGVDENDHTCAASHVPEELDLMSRGDHADELIVQFLVDILREDNRIARHSFRLYDP